MKKLIAFTLAGALSHGSAGLAEDLKMSTVAPGTSGYLTMSTMATLVNSNQDEHNITVDATGAATKHMIDLAKGEIDFGMTAPVLVQLMKGQKAMYQKLDNAAELAENLRLVYWFPWGPVHYITYAEDGMTSIDDIRGKTVFLGPPGGGAWNSNNEWVVAQTGMVAGEDYVNFNGSWSSAFQAFQDRQVDVYVVGGVPPFPQMEQLIATSDIRLLGPTKAEIDAQSDEMTAPSRAPGRQLTAIDPASYGGRLANTEPVYTYSVVVGLATRADLDEETVYNVTKTFWEAAEAQREATPWLKHITVETGIQNGGLPLHPGAQRYYKEAGFTIPEGSMAPAN
ncbi:MAG: TAXI family TRAP transporter solute-binding subunit [Proteobacteria bacterium]|nr:TAXI family TRAP transporter solute-binding subunit [Pseudomonadota bacterium]